MKSKLNKIIEQYGRWVIIIYLSTFAATFVGVFFLLQIGFKDSILTFFEEHLGASYGSAGTLVLAYAVTKITQPLRIALTIALVPFFGKKSTQS